jgi:ribonuclease-3
MVDDNYKDQLMRFCQTRKYNLPFYEWSSENGQFYVQVYIDEIAYGRGDARSKKQAEQYAAYDTLLKVCPGFL